MSRVPAYMHDEPRERSRTESKNKEKSFRSPSDTLECSDDGLPEGHIEKYFGSIKDETFDVPEDLPWPSDEDELFN
ncbi:MAG: hypothetical protein FWD81_00335 [Methanomassiliicoccaceae archaeon]|nr:hypothetical protein [Methanomassiliicoccaceae archaeon]